MTTQHRPHIVFITAEQQRFDTIRATGAEWMHTPHMDALAGESMVFEQAFCPAATCVSSRTAFYTGLWPHNTGVYGFDRSSGRLHWLHRLREAGYHCASIGKTHLPPAGFDESIAALNNKYAPYRNQEPPEWHVAVRRAGYEPPLHLHEEDPDFYDNLGAITWPLPEELHPDIWTADRALEWIDRWNGVGPFYLHIGFLSPHDLYDPPQRFLDLYDQATIPLPEVTDEERAGIPDELYASQRRDEAREGITMIKAGRATPPRIRRMRRHYYALVSLIDERLGLILERLRDRGLYEDAIVVYTSDHGDHLFDHGLYYKGELYDTIVHMPLMIRDPAMAAPQSRPHDLVSHLDVARYLLERAGVEAGDLDGISLAPTVLEGRPHPREYVYAEEGATGLRTAPDLLAMIRSRTHKLVHFQGGRTGQLFDLEADPGETRNLWKDPEYRAVRERLTAHMLDWLLTNGYRHRELFAGAR